MSTKELIRQETVSKNSKFSDKTSPTTDQDQSVDWIEAEENSIFEAAFKKYYVDSSQNKSINFDSYLLSALKLISYFPNNINTQNYLKTQIQSKSEHLPPNESSSKKTLILDMDETLIHADVDFNFKFHDEFLKFTYANNENLIPLIIRPHWFEFLDYVSEHFEIVIFTASEREYADTILDYIEKNKKYFSKRLYRDSCIFWNPGLYIKDLRIIKNRNLRDLIIVDNSLFAFANQLNNGILISSFFSDKSEEMLVNLMSYLSLCKDCDDIREFNKMHFQYENYLIEITKEREDKYD